MSNVEVILQLPDRIEPFQRDLQKSYPTTEERGISAHRDILREQAKAVLLEYSERGGLIYNPRTNETSA